MGYKSVILNDDISLLSILKKIKELSVMNTKGMYLYFIASIKYIKTRSILCTNRILEYSSFSLYPLPFNFFIMIYFFYTKNDEQDDQNGGGKE